MIPRISGRSLQRAGKWLHLWRVAGKFANVSIFKVSSPGELHARGAGWGR
jgi:muconolactone D-isomerase